MLAKEIKKWVAGRILYVEAILKGAVNVLGNMQLDPSSQRQAREPSGSLLAYLGIKSNQSFLSPVPEF